MGTDIHMAIEVQDDKGAWHTHGKGYDDRHYDVFAVLADVRNGFGFAGVKRGEVLPVIAEPRGLPEDMDPASNKFLSDEHTPSWLTVAEILAFLEEHKGHVSPRTGVIKLEQVPQFLKDGEPQSWSGGVSGPNVVNIGLDRAKRLLAAEEVRDPRKSYYVQVDWTTGLLDLVRPLVEFVNSLAPLGEPERVRLVFDFDS